MEIEKMALVLEGRLGEEGPRPVLSEPLAAILDWYEAEAPERLREPEAWPAPGGPVSFERQVIGFPDAVTPEPAISNVALADLDRDGLPELVATDMRQGVVMWASPTAPERGAAPLALVPNPSHVTATDLDADGAMDLLVADLGEFFPGDHDRGGVVWLRRTPSGGFDPRVLGSFPRVADTGVADFDGDGQPDVVVAAFGWWRRGHLGFLRSSPAGPASGYEASRIDERTGAIHVIPVDLDRDAKLDFVALLAQEHESVVAFLGDGQGGFTPRTLFAGPHPAWGASGLSMADLDADGAPAFLLTNGDMFDDQLLQPYHGVQWLENRGELRFELRPLAPLAGAHRAVAADLDGDGDLDVAAAAFVGGAESSVPLPSLVWLEQVDRGQFERHTLALGDPAFATLAAGDVDADGDVDLVTGYFVLGGESEAWLEVWENRGAAPSP
jgi:hypothetical protein